MNDDLSDILSLFRGRCGHQWVGATRWLLRLPAESPRCDRERSR
jgi:hypothetical protein